MTDFGLEEIRPDFYDKRGPVTCALDDWIYCTSISQSVVHYSIYRMRSDGSDYQEVLKDSTWTLNTFSVSYNGQMLAAPKYNDDESYIILYNLVSKEIVKEFNFTEYGIALYAAFTRDNQYILFVLGPRGSSRIKRNIYRMNLDGSNLIQLTDFPEGEYCNRPLAW